MVYPLSTMIQDAVFHIRQQKGNTFADIYKHLQANQNKKLDGINKKMLTSTLTGLVQTGQLQKKGSYYKLPVRRSIPRRRRRRHRRRQGRRRRHNNRRRRHHRRLRRRKHHHCPKSTRSTYSYRPPNPSGHRHCPRR